MEEQQRLEIAARIHALQERSPWSQPVVADRLGLSLRGYQKMLERGTTKWERAEELAAIHIEWAAEDPEWIARATAGWIWDGRERRIAPNLLAAFADDEDLRDQLERISRHQALILKALLGLVGNSLEDQLGDAIQRALREAEPSSPVVADTTPGGG